MAQAAVIAREVADVARLPPAGAAQGRLLQGVYGLSADWTPSGWSGLWRHVGAGSDHPTIATVLASLVEVYGGGERLGLLLLNLVLLLACEVAFAVALLRLTRSAGLTAFGTGLFLLRKRPWLLGTGLFTVNVDWPASCLFSLAASLMISPPARRPILRILAVALLGLATLCLSATSFACLLAVAALRVACSWPADVRRLAAAAGLAAAAAALLGAAPFCPAMPTTGIRLDGGEVARCGYGLRTATLYLASFDLGPKVLAAATLALGTAAWTALRRARGTWLRLGFRAEPEAAFLAAVVAALALVQVARRSADSVGSGLVDVPLLALVVACIAALLQGRPRRGRRPVRLACFGFLALSGLLGLGYPPLDGPPVDDRRRSAQAEAALWLVRDAEAHARPGARIIAPASLPLLAGPGLSAFFYETFGEAATFTVADPHVGAADIGAFDYAVMPREALAGTAGTALLRGLDIAMVRRARLDPQGLDLAVYSAPEITVSGVSGDWLLSAGTTLRFVAGEIPDGSAIALRGSDGYATYMPESPRVTASATTPGGGTLPLPARFIRQDGGYAIYVDPAPLKARGGEANVALTFDRFFVPKEVGLNADPRRLVVIAPTFVGLVPKREAFEGPAPDAATSPAGAVP